VATTDASAALPTLDASAHKPACLCVRYAAMHLRIAAQSAFECIYAASVHVSHDPPPVLIRY
jgi:hypothetical protein